MDRRNFLKRGVMGASGAVVAGKADDGGPAEARRRPPLAPADLDAYIEVMDAGVARIREWPLSESFSGFAFDSPASEELVRTAVHSLYVTGMFGDLPVENQVDPRVQRRLWDAQPVMDEALARMETFIAEVTPERLARAQSTLRDRPEVLHAIVDTIDREGAESGVSEARRGQLRAIFGEVGWRLQKQPPDLVIREYTEKVERVTASDVAAEARQRWLAARVGADAFWDVQESLRDRRISRGLKAMGIGILAFGVGAALVTLGDDHNADALIWLGLIPGITGGSILFVAGLVILISGLATSREAT